MLFYQIWIKAFHRIYFVLLCYAVLWFLVAGKLAAQDSINYHYGYELVSKVIFTNSRIINQFLHELFIPEDSARAIEIFDIDKNGPSEGDLIRVEPSQNVYNLTGLSKDLMNVLTGLEPDTSFEVVGLTLNISDSSGRPEEKFLRQLMKTVASFYPTTNPIRFYFEQNDDGTFKFVLFNYKRSWLTPPNELSSRDIIKLFYKEFVEEFKDFLPMVMVVNKSVIDTVYIPVSPHDKK